MLRSSKLCPLGIRFARTATKGWPGSQTSLSGKTDGSHLLALPSARFPVLQLNTSLPWAPPPARRGDGASRLGCRTDSLWAREHSMARALMRPQLQVRTQNDPASFTEENCHAAPAVPNQAASPQTLAQGRGGGRGL